MINIVHAVFRWRVQRGNMGPPLSAGRLLAIALVAASVGPAQGAPFPTAEPEPPVPSLFPHAVADAVTSSCAHRPCRVRPPGPADRDVRPFEGSLGRPCAWRQRETPSGPRRVRICF